MSNEKHTESCNAYDALENAAAVTTETTAPVAEKETESAAEAAAETVAEIMAENTATDESDEDEGVKVETLAAIAMTDYEAKWLAAELDKIEGRQYAICKCYDYCPQAGICTDRVVLVVNESEDTLMYILSAPFIFYDRMVFIDCEDIIICSAYDDYLSGKDTTYSKCETRKQKIDALKWVGKSCWNMLEVPHGFPDLEDFAQRMSLALREDAGA